jgi:hypothetical protein
VRSQIVCDPPTTDEQDERLLRALCEAIGTPPAPVVERAKRTVDRLVDEAHAERPLL